MFPLHTPAVSLHRDTRFTVARTSTWQRYIS